MIFDIRHAFHSICTVSLSSWSRLTQRSFTENVYWDEALSRKITKPVKIKKSKKKNFFKSFFESFLKLMINMNQLKNKICLAKSSIALFQIHEIQLKLVRFALFCRTIDKLAWSINSWLFYSLFCWAVKRLKNLDAFCEPIWCKILKCQREREWKEKWFVTILCNFAAAA